MGKDDKSDKRKKKDKEKKSKSKSKDGKRKEKSKEKRNSESGSEEESVQEMDLFAEPGNTGPHPLPSLTPANEVAKDNAEELLKESVQTKLKKIEELSENEKIKNLQGDFLEKLKKFFRKEEDDGLKQATFSKVLDELEKGHLNGKNGTDCVTYLIGELNASFFDLYAHFACQILDRFFDDSRHDGAVFMFLPKLLSGIAEQEKIWADGFSSHGNEYKTHIIEAICEKEWPKGLVTILLTNLRDVDFNEKELEFLTAKFIQSLSEIDIEELPSLVYQLLLFSVKGNQEQILQGVTGHFVRPKSREGSQLAKQRHIEGTILHHLDIAMKRDQNLPNLYLKLVKNAKIRLSPFTIALLLLLARGKNQTAIFDFIKEVLLKEFQGIKPNTIAWLDAEEGAAKHLEENGSVETSLLDVVENSQFGWNLAFCLVDLGILLMDTTIPKISEISQQHSKQIIMTGNVILQRTFKYHELIRKKVFDTILARVVTRDGNSTFYVSLLKNIIQSSVDDMSDLASKIKQIFDCLPSILPTIAVQIVNSTQPIIHMNKSVQDHLVLVLRKSIFQREIDTRIVALTCFLELLQDNDYARIYANDEFGNEILGSLRRCFSQQCIVRKELYMNLFKTFENNKNLRESIIDLLLTQFKVYVKGEPEEVLDFSQFIHGKPQQNGPNQVQSPDGVYFIEPFQTLLHYLCRCIQIESHEKKVPTYIKNCSTLINSFINNMLKSELEEYELDKSSSFDITTVQGNYNQHSAYLLLSIYEGLIEYLITGPDSKGKYKKILGLYETILQIKSAIKLSFKEKPATQSKSTKKKGNKKGNTEKDVDNSELISNDESEDGSESESTTVSEKRRGKKSAAMLKEFVLPPNLSFNCIISLVELCNQPIEEFENSSDESLIALKKKFSFIQWVLESTVSHLKEFPKSSVGQDESNKIRADFCLKIGKPTFEMFLFYGGKEAKEDSKTVSCLALESFELCTRYMAESGKLDLLAKYLDTAVVAEKDDDNILEEDDDDGSDAFKIHANIIKLEKILWEVLSGDINVFKYGLVLMDLISLLSEHLPKKMLSSHSVFVDRVCQKEIQNIPFAKSAITAYSKISDKIGSLKLYENVARDLHIELGDNMIENESLLDGKSTRFKIINAETRSVISSVIIQRLSTQLTQISTVWEAIHQSIRLKKLKQKINYTNPQQQQQRDALTQEAKELKSTQKIIFTRIMGVLTTLHYLASSIAPVKIAQQSIKLLTQVYKIITNLYKDLEIIFNSTKLTPSKKFEELIKYMGQQFTHKVYQFLVVMDPLISGKVGCNSEIKLMPSLVFEIENFEGATIKFEQLTGMKLYSEFRRSTSRDFQIKLTAKAEEESDDDAGKGKKGKKKSNEKEATSKKKSRKKNDDENEDEDEPKTKKKKKTH